MPKNKNIIFPLSNENKKYLIVGCLNSIIGYSAIFTCMYHFDMNPIMSNMIGTAIGLFFSYFLHRAYTFNSQKKKIPEVLKFIFSILLSYSLSLIALKIFIELSLNPGISQIFSGGLYIIISFLLNKYFVFNNPKFATNAGP